MADVKVIEKRAHAIVAALDALGVSAENVTRLLNYEFEDFTFSCVRGEYFKATITGVSDNANHFRPFDVWKQP